MANDLATMVAKKGKWRRRARRMGVTFLCFYGVVLWFVGCGHLVDHLVMFPIKGEVDARGAVREMVTVPEVGEVELWTARSPGAKDREPVAFVMFFVGNADRADRWCTLNAGQWGDKPVELVGMNYPGYGGSGGEPYLKNVGPAALATYDWVKARAKGRPIFVQANSLGTTAALCVLARREVAGATIQNPPALKQLFVQHHGWWNLWLLAIPSTFMVPNELDSVANAKQSKAPAVFVLSEKDEVVPVRFQRMVQQAYAGENKVIDVRGATHNSGMGREEYEEFGRQLDWLWGKAGL